MRRGIGLRGYAQQDPLNEFKREAFQLYDELRGLIRHGVASSIFRVTVTRQPPQAAGGDPAVAASLARGAAALAGAGGNGANGAGAGGRGHRSARARRRSRPRAAAGGSADPARRPGRAGRRGQMRESLGDEPVVERRRAGSAERAEAGVHARAAPGSGATTRAGAVRAPSTRSATVADRRRPASGVRRPAR